MSSKFITTSTSPQQNSSTYIDDISLYILVVLLQVQLYQLYLYKYSQSSRYQRQQKHIRSKLISSGDSSYVIDWLHSTVTAKYYYYHHFQFWFNG